ncbi:Pentatricopeptide repeat-containing protein [Apostasia shenzhenica]|uniref:Pentatricopeptide repeat-containing protein n=1 Tax=Apostasia shenzhenica TaxID=1088818 RepID=A0A2I0AW01_9ASPA|nr:Pentatricopeptide repeat-containing protein [Apostasia shenzhenica]
MNFHRLLRRCRIIRQLQAAHAAAAASGILSRHPGATLAALLKSLAVLRPLPPPSLSLPYALSLFHSFPHPPSTFFHNYVIRLHLSLDPPSLIPAVLLFSRLRSLSLPPDTHSFPLALSAASRLRLLRLGRSLHAQTVRFGFSGNLYVRNALISMYSSTSLPDAGRVFHEQPTAVDIVTYNTLIDGYIKAGKIDDAYRLFDEMPVRDAVSWGTILAGHAGAGRHWDALQLFGRMLAAGFQPDDVALVSALSGCAQQGELDRGRAVHDYIRSNRTGLTVYLSTALLDMYAKCGAIEAAVKVFDESPHRNLFTWNAIIVGLAMHGRGELSLEYFRNMAAAGVQPDGVTFLGALVACSHCGLMETARRIFSEMESVHGVRRELKHYGCMADLLGRAGLIGEAVEMIEGMPVDGDKYVWGGLLAGCRIHSENVEVAEVVARKLLELDPGNGGVYTILGEMYASGGRWEDAARMRRLADGLKGKKRAGQSVVEVPCKHSNTIYSLFPFTTCLERINTSHN